jgi:hypothetical protein
LAGIHLRKSGLRFGCPLPGRLGIEEPAVPAPAEREELLDVVDTARAVRRELRDGQPPAYLFSSPCCGAHTLLPAWVIEYARRRTNGRLLIQCGRYGSDPLRPAGAIPALGCGSRFVVEL